MKLNNLNKTFHFHTALLICGKLFLKGYFWPKAEKMNIVIKFRALELAYAHFLISNSISLSFKLFHPCTILSHHQSCFQYEVVSEITVSLEPWILLHVYLTWEGKSSCIYFCRVLQLRQSYIWNQLRDLIQKKHSVRDLTFSVNAEWGVVEIILLITSVKPFESSLKINFY